jgi:phenylalanyl-tRNA synthetase alpha chain
MAEDSITPTPEILDTVEQEVAVGLSAIASGTGAEEFRIKYLGKKGVLSSLVRGVKDLPPDQRRSVGARTNALFRSIEESFKTAPWAKKQDAAGAGPFDPTLPGFPFPHGSVHPLTQIRNRIRDIFTGMGFDIAYGPEVETDYYNFGALNFQPNHPARDMQDTFYVIAEDVLLRTHTSPVQVRVMLDRRPPIRCIMPGRVYRNEEVSSRSYCLFHQVEGLYVDEHVSFADLKGTLLSFAKQFFDEKTRIKIRPSFFPFTEPSVEVDVECFLCDGKGCPLCKQSGWLEILGAGMVHPNVLANCGIDNEKYTGFAFGMGIERISLLKFGIDDIRILFENDVRFLRQF